MKWHCNFCVTKTRHILVQISHGLILSLLFGLAFGLFLMMLWNVLVPDIWGWKEITYWQGVGLVILTRLLFGSHGYQKEANQPQAGCRTHFPQQKTDWATSNSDKYYEQWWDEEGEASLEKYTEKLVEKASSQQDSKK